VHPNRIIAVVGGHADDDKTIKRKGRGDAPVESVSVDRTGSFTASCSHDGLVKFFDIASLSLDAKGEDGESSEDDSDEGGRRGRRKKRKRSKSKAKRKARDRRATLNSIQTSRKP